MKPITKLSKRHLLLLALFFIASFIVLLPEIFAGEMQNYCLVPPYVKRDIHPNIVIMMDNSTIMGSRAYSGSTCRVGTNGCYITTTTYYGIFKPNIYYCYGSNEWDPSTTCGTLNSTTSNPLISGNLLNWLTTSQYDLLEGILLGGKSASRQNNASINKIQSIGNAWNITLTYTDSAGATRVCDFIINNANIEVKDHTAGSCGYFDIPAKPIPSDPTLSFIPAKSEESVADASSPEDNEEKSLTKDAFVFSAKKLLVLFSKAMDLIAGDAEAAPTYVKINGQGNPVDISNPTECTGGYTFAVSASESNSTAPYTWSLTNSTAGTMGCAAGQYPISSTVDTGLCFVPATDLISAKIVGAARYAALGGTQYTFAVHVQDSAGNSDTRNFRVTFNHATVTVDLTQTPDPLNPGNSGAWYRESIIAAGACVKDTVATATSWSISASNLPGTLIFPSASNPIHYDRSDITGTPTTTGSYTFTANVTDIAGNTASQIYHLTINASLDTFQISTATPLTPGTVGAVYQSTVSTAGFSTTWPCSSGCNQGWLWSISAGALPPGLFINTAGGCLSGDHVYITGTPTTAGTYSFTVSVTTNPVGCGGTATKAFTLVIAAAPTTVRTTGNTNVILCAGDTHCNCNNSTTSACTPGTAPCSPSFTDQCVLKTGIVDQFWPQARFGIEDFKNNGPLVEKAVDSSCSTTPPSDFYTAIENATPLSAVTPLVNGEYTAIDYYANDTGNNTDPFRSSSGSCAFGTCLKNFVLMLSAGVGADNPPTPSGGTPNVDTDATHCGSANFKNLTKNACYGYSNDLRTDNTNYPGKQNVSTFIVNTMGTPVTANYNTANLPSNTGEILKQAALSSNGLYYEVTNPALLRDALIQAFQDILQRAASGTAASVLASGEGSGANLIQAVFYPRRKFDDTEISWIGRLTNLWYYVDPFFATSSIFEDNASTRKLNLEDDYKISLHYNSTLERTEATRYTNPSGDGNFVLVSNSTSTPNPVAFENLSSLWEAGLELWKRDISAYKRKIYTTIDGTQFLTGNFSQDTANSDADNAATLQPYFNLTVNDDMYGNDGVITIDDARTLIRYVHGEDFTGLRPRTVKVDLNGNGNFTDTDVVLNGVHYDETVPRVWKLGDILNATPKISSWAPLNLYNINYKDTTYQSFLNSSTYQSRGMVFAGGNDGMLHAFKLGTLDVSGPLVTGYTKAALCNDSNGDRQCTQAEINAATDLGKEQWAFIPKNVLPYLKHLTKTDYCHVYSVDLTPYIFDASINKPTGCSETNYWNCNKTVESWRTILIGGMRYGGACRNMGTACNGGTTDCVNTPVANNGYSSYFALDVTDQNNPTLLWEFSDPTLGFSTSGPVVMKINARKINSDNTASEPYPMNTKNDRWFVVLGSGPTGPISTSDNQFLGRSDQNLKVFILDLKGPGVGNAWVPNTNYWVKDSGKANAFSGSILGSSVDTDYDFQDNVMYVPYVQKCAATDGICTVDTWTNGGIMRLVTHQDKGSVIDNPSTDLNNTALNPANWSLSPVIGNVGPVTSSVVNLQNRLKGQLWLYFASGRYYYENSTTTDDATGQRQLFGLKEPCYSTGGFDPNCTSTRSFCTYPTTSTPCGDLTNVTSIANVPTNPDAANYYGWYINLDPYTSGGTFNAERSISNPFAITSGVAFFSTYKPYQDTCAFGGNSNLWAVNYNTGGAPGALQGMVLLQSSTGSIEQINLSQRLTQQGGRETTNVEGKPPEGDPPPLLSSPPAVKRVIHVRER